LPVGVSNDTTVRCPLCHAHYTLADALVNMPPLLEVVQDAGDAPPEDWYDEPAAKAAPSDLVAEALDEDGLDGEALSAAALPEDESEAETLELGSLELESLELDEAEAFDDAHNKETLVDDLSTLAAIPTGSPEPNAKEDDALLDFDAPVATPVEDGDLAEELTAGELSENEPESELKFDGDDELSLDFGGEPVSAEGAGAETLEFTPSMAESFGEKADDEVKFDLESDDDVSDEAATIEFGAPLGDDDPLFGETEGEVKFDFDEAGDAADEVETVRFESPTTTTGDDEVEFNFDAPEAESSDEGLRGFEDIKVDASGEAEDIPLDLPVAAVSAVPVGEEVATGKKGKKEKKKKEKKPKAESTGDKPKRSLVGMLVGLMLAIPAALIGSLWLGPDYDILGVSKFLPSAMLPADFSKKPAQLAYVPPVATPAAPATETPAEEPAAAEGTPTEEPAPENTEAAAPGDAAATEHSAARPVEETPAGVEPAPAAEAPAEEMPAPAEAVAADAPTLTPPSDAAATPDAGAPADTAEPDPFAPADSTAATPAAETPAAAAPESAAEPEADPFAPAKEEAPAAEMPADKPAAEGDDLFAPADTSAAAPAAEQPADAAAPAEEMPAEETPAEEDPFAPAPADKPADAPAESDPFAPAEPPPTSPETTRPEEADPFAPADKPAETPAEEPALPTDKPMEEEIVAPTPEAMPETRPAEPDPFAPAPADKPAADKPAEALPAPVEPADAPAETAPLPAAPSAPAEALGPRSVASVSPAALQGAVQSTFVSSQQLTAAEAAGDEAQLRKARAAFYVNLFGMADAITSAQLGPGGAAVDQQLQSLGGVIRQQLAADPKRLDALKVFGARWIGFPKRTTNGVVVSGTVESAEQVGKLFHTKARLGSAADAPLVTIVTAKKPDVASGDMVLALGSIVDDPQQKISGYEGSDPAVVWSGMTMKVAP
jgi:hypothetical protein